MNEVLPKCAHCTKDIVGHSLEMHGASVVVEKDSRIETEKVYMGTQVSTIETTQRSSLIRHSFRVCENCIREYASLAKPYRPQEIRGGDDLISNIGAGALMIGLLLCILAGIAWWIDGNPVFIKWSGIGGGGLFVVGCIIAGVCMRSDSKKHEEELRSWSSKWEEQKALAMNGSWETLIQSTSAWRGRLERDTIKSLQAFKGHGREVIGENEYEELARKLDATFDTGALCRHSPSALLR